MTTYSPFDVVEVPFPFSDLPKSKKRKALVLSTTEFNQKNGNSILMMITSGKMSDWFLDVEIENWNEAGLKKPCIARMKFFTLDNGLILSKSGELNEKDRIKIRTALKSAIPI